MSGFPVSGLPVKAALRPLCHNCELPILRGQPHWAGDPLGRHWHYDCAEQAGLTRSHRPQPARKELSPG